MSQVITTLEGLQALPVGTKVLDKDGDTLRRVTDGWTYRTEDQLLGPGAFMHHRLLGRYLPMVTLDEPAPLAMLDDPALHQVIGDYIEQEFAARHPATRTDPTDPYKLAAYYITQAVKEHMS